MEKLKKTILQAVTTGITACTGTTGTCHIIIPDLTAVYHMKIGLKQEPQDIGFFDVSGTTYIPPPPVDTFVVKTGIAINKPIVAYLRVVGNELILSGDSTIVEYGTIYTSGTTNITDSTLIINNTNVQKVSIVGSIVEGELYHDLLIDLKEFRKYYYRAFVINCDNTAYGDIKDATTGGIIPT